MANNRKARSGTMKQIGVKIPVKEDREQVNNGKKCKDRTLAHKRPADWKEKKKQKRREQNKARIVKH